MPRNHRNNPILQYLHFQLTTRNTYWQHNKILSVVLFNFHTLLLIRFKSTDLLFLLLWNYPLISWHIITHSHAQIFRGMHICFSNEYRGKSRFEEICCCTEHYNRHGFFCSQFQVTLHGWTPDTFEFCSIKKQSFHNCAINILNVVTAVWNRNSNPRI